jgi:hypothetical protein
MATPIANYESITEVHGNSTEINVKNYFINITLGLIGSVISDSDFNPS